MSDYSKNPIDVLESLGYEVTPRMEQLRQWANEPVSCEGTVYGAEWTSEGRIIAALVKRLGGRVVLAVSELEAVKGLSMSEEPGEYVDLSATI